MNTLPGKLPALTSYYIRKLLRQNEHQLQSVVAAGAALMVDDQVDLNSVLESLYLDEVEIAAEVEALETLVRYHQILASQSYASLQQLQQIEREIFWIFGLKRLRQQSVPGRDRNPSLLPATTTVAA